MDWIIMLFLLKFAWNENYLTILQVIKNVPCFIPRDIFGEDGRWVESILTDNALFPTKCSSVSMISRWSSVDACSLSGRSRPIKVVVCILRPIAEGTWLWMGIELYDIWSVVDSF